MSIELQRKQFRAAQGATGTAVTCGRLLRIAMNEFTPESKGGFHAGKVATQDIVATVISVEAIAGLLDGVTAGILDAGGRLALEAEEDIELRWDGGIQYISVKDRQITRSDIVDGFAWIEDKLSAWPTGWSVTLRFEAEYEHKCPQPI